MNSNYISISIEGDFVDSFIYSGTLFIELYPILRTVLAST